MDPFKPYQPRKPAPPSAKLSLDEAESVALQAVAYIVSDDVLLPRFAGLTGCGLDNLPSRIGDRAFLAAVLDFILGDEATVVAFAEHQGLSPEIPIMARETLLPGQDW